MVDVVPTTYCTIDVQTERLGELQLLLNANGFRLQWVEDKTRERWALPDDGKEIEGAAGAGNSQNC